MARKKTKSHQKVDKQGETTALLEPEKMVLPEINAYQPLPPEPQTPLLSEASESKIFITRVKKNRVLSLAVALVLLLILLWIFTATFLSRSTVVFELQSKVTMEVFLETAEITFVTSSEGADVGDLFDLENIKGQEIFNYFINKGVKSENIHKNQNFYALTNSSLAAIPGSYGSLQTFYKVVVHNLANEASVSQLLSGLYEIGINRMGVIVFTSESLAEKCQQMRIEAMDMAEKRAKEMIRQKNGGKILESNFQVLADCSGQNFDYYGASDQNSHNSALYGSADPINGFSSQRENLKTVVKVTVKYLV